MVLRGRTRGARRTDAPFSPSAGPPTPTTIPIPLDEDTTAKALSSLRRYCAEELDLELRELPAQLFLEFILTEIGPSIYNAALGDAQSFLRDRVADLEDAMHQPEFGYSNRKGAKRSR